MSKKTAKNHLAARNFSTLFTHYFFDCDGAPRMAADALRRQLYSLRASIDPACAQAAAAGGAARILDVTTRA
ncbi:hypothetical protein FE772_09030 [Lysobacter enzymogenes]|nr:hypothetical protein [Lysobacter enzymogenes]QCW25788.1 hypothetical protein FE772_09030 [Lysobacter enzymogenes]